MIILGAISKHRVKYELDHWTGPSDPWTIFLDNFLDHYFGPFLDHFFGPFYRGGCTLLVLREAGKGGIQSISTKGGVRARLLLLRKGWKTNY